MKSLNNSSNDQLEHVGTDLRDTCSTCGAGQPPRPFSADELLPSNAPGTRRTRHGLVCIGMIHSDVPRMEEIEAERGEAEAVAALAKAREASKVAAAAQEAATRARDIAAKAAAAAAARIGEESPNEWQELGDGASSSRWRESSTGKALGAASRHLPTPTPVPSSPARGPTFGCTPTSAPACPLERDFTLDTQQSTGNLENQSMPKASEEFMENEGVGYRGVGSQSGKW
ncbi:unnamed protein product, partial [Discosporangium mesarthrocarpum]